MNVHLFKIFISMLSISVWGGTVCFLISEEKQSKGAVGYLCCEVVSVFIGFICGLLALDDGLSTFTVICIAGVTSSIGQKLLEGIQEKVMVLLSKKMY
ncbi:TPA: hypothetical protein O3H02_004654 [Salmonella enterica subsp. enterica serovar Saintpaul str. CFSAN004144]|nr:hypothetical protein [Salmonella enterica subsp. enterica serovar Saintpaul str. CFSAN004144]